MEGMLVFHNGSDTSYANYAGNLSSISSASLAITLNFASTVGTSASNDSVVLTIDAGEEEAVMEFLSQTMLTGRMKVIADDQNSVYIHQAITAVASISVDNGAGTFKSIIPATFTTADTGLIDNRIIATNAHSGSVFTVNAGTDAASTVYLPASPITGWNAKFLCNHPSDAHTITITENGTSTAFQGLSIQAGGHVEHTGTASAVIAASDYKLGDWFACSWDGTIWDITGSFDTASSMAVS
jgi:hypothetical protein